MTVLLVAALVAVGAIALAAYWALVVTEAAFLGPRAVVWLYDRGADTYDAAKRFDRHDEAAEIGNPLLDRLEASAPPGVAALEDPGVLVLDVAAGTGRVAATLLAMPHFAGTVVCLDLSARMLEEASHKAQAWGERCALIRHEAGPLPFADASFDAVTLLEALEFLPRRHAALEEIWRVLVPGGWFLFTNRTGIDRWLLPGRVDAPEALVRRLESLGFDHVTVERWLSYYDLVWARKAPMAGPVTNRAASWTDALRCRRCGADRQLRVVGDRMTCRSCGAMVDRNDGYWDLTR